MEPRQVASPGTFMRAMQWVMPRFSPVHTSLYRAFGGRLGTDRMTLGAPVLLLTTTGRRTGSPRSVPIGHMRIEGDIIVAGTNGGTQPVPSWVLNLRADPECHVQLRSESFAATAEFLQKDEYESRFARLADAYPTYRQARSWVARDIPLIRLRPVNTNLAVDDLAGPG
jgi:F420H(2)-dependent quinone reductase